jgi:PAS domain S-box-containing protein
VSAPKDTPSRKKSADEALTPGQLLPSGDQLFSVLVQGVVDYAIVLLNPEGIVTTWNAGAQQINGYAANDIIGRHFSIFYTPEDRAAGAPGRTLGAAAREGRFEGAGWRVRRDGTRFWASVVVGRILDGDGQLVGFAKITRDLTEQRRAEEELERTRAALAQAQKMEALGQLTGGVAHDFNNLLTVIANALDLLSAPTGDEVRRQRITESARRAAERGARLTQQLLVFSRRQQLRPQAHDINGLIAGFEAVLRRACPEPIAFELRRSRRPVAANIDAPQFENALLNLVVNARDAMVRGGTLVIVTGCEAIDAEHARAMSDIPPGDYVTVAVRDSGQGMPPTVMARAFEPFFTTKEIGKGSGLGLSQVYGFVMQSGGHVVIDSAPGSGTTVTLYLPAAAAVTAHRKANGGEPHQDAATGRVLVVEDDPEVLQVAVEILRHFGYDVLTAPDASRALAVLKRERHIDILFTDIVMPRGMNGIELARTALQLRPQLRVLLASGYPRAARQVSYDDAAGAGEFAFLAKPYRGAELAAALRALHPAM